MTGFVSHRLKGVGGLLAPLDPDLRLSVSYPEEFSPEQKVNLHSSSLRFEIQILPPLCLSVLSWGSM